MASPSRPLAFMLHCRQARCLSQAGLNLPTLFHNSQCFLQHTRPASTTSQPSSAPTRSPFPSQRPSGAHSSPRDAQNPSRRPIQFRTAQPLNLWTAIKSVFGWKPTPAPPNPTPAFTAINNPYRARKEWPPDFTTLHPKHQFHYEKTFRRRIKLKYARPRWIMGTKIVQYGLMVVIVVYWVFFLKVEGESGTPFDALRKWSFNAWQNLGKVPEESRQEMDRLPRPQMKLDTDQSK